MYKIQKKVPIPTPKAGIPIYPFADMDIGDSFSPLVGPRDDCARIRNSILGSVRHGRKRFPGRKFITRIVPKGGEWEIRCWRVK